MAAIDLIAPTHRTRINLAFSPTKADPSFSKRHALLRPRTLSLSSAPDSAHLPETLDLFPDLPSLHFGRPDTHLRAGVIAAQHRGLSGEPDAGRAFFVADLSSVLAQHQRWLRALPDIEPFYAVKCNPDPYVLRLLAALGCGFDCASNGEIKEVLGLSGLQNPASPERIIFANPCKPTSFVRAAERAGVEMMTFDNPDELYKIKKVYPLAKLVLRILTDDSQALCQLGLKFGARMEAVPGLLTLAKELGLNVIGISFHVGSGSQDPHAFSDAISRARRAFDYGTQAGYHFTFLDVGGGFEATPEFELRAAVLREAMERDFPAAERKAKGIRVIAEPGRFYVADAFRLAVCVIARRKAVEGQKTMYYINDGVYGAFNCILFDHQHPTPHVLSLSHSFHVPSLPLHSSSIWGPTCDSIDCISTDSLLPTMDVGDWMWFAGMGAYTRCAASRFNGFEVSAVVYTAGVGPLGKEVSKVLKQAAAVPA